MLGLKVRKNILLASVIVYGAVLIYLALLPRDTALHILKSKQNFGPAHMAAYFFFSLWLSFLLRFQRSIMNVKMTHKLCVSAATVAAGIMAVLTETVQIYSLDRTPDLMDIYVDLLGALSGVLVYVLAVNYRKWFFANPALFQNAWKFPLPKTLKNKFPAH